MSKFTKCAAVVAALMALTASSASAALIYTPSGYPVEPEQTWADTASIPLGDESVTLVYGACRQSPAGPWSCVDLRSLTMTLAPLVRWQRKPAFFHEMGHEWDLRNPPRSGAVRARFRELNGFTEGAWAPLGWWDDVPWLSHEDGARPSLGELFADAVSYCAVLPPEGWGRALMGWTSGYGWHPSASAARATCQMLKRNM